MFQKKAVLGLILATFALAGCVSEEKTTPPASTPTPAPEIVYAQGFFDLERDGNLSWRWMEPEGVIRLKNSGKDMVLKVSGRAPVERFKQAPIVKISLNGTQLDQVTTTPEVITREFTITPAQQGTGEWSDLRITCDKSFVPKDSDPGATDPRRLAFSLTNITWQAK